MKEILLLFTGLLIGGITMAYANYKDTRYATACAWAWTTPTDIRAEKIKEVIEYNPNQ